MNTYKITMTETADDYANSLEIEADSLVQAAFIAGAHWAGNVATCFQARVFGVHETLNSYLPVLENGEIVVIAEQI